MVQQVVEWHSAKYAPDVLMLSTGMWDLLWLGAASTYESSLRHFADVLTAWHASLVRFCALPVT